jgi:hypothetical protein
MRKNTEMKYVNSANLFSFCKNILDVKFTNARVIDQDVGQILGFDPADCSNWKKGRKNVRSIEAIDAIANHLGVDQRFVIDVANGEISVDEAMLEYRGLGHLEVDSSVADGAKKEWQRSHAIPWTSELDERLRAFFSINEVALNAIVEKVLAKINFIESPLFLPEITNAYENLKFVSRQRDPSLSGREISSTGRWLEDGTFAVEFIEGSQTRPVMRFHLVRAMAPYFVGELYQSAHNDFSAHEPYMKDVYCNVFAARLLVPARLVREEMSRIDLGRDIVTQLAEVFWVSRSLANVRLRDILCGSEPYYRS